MSSSPNKLTGGSASPINSLMSTAATAMKMAGVALNASALATGFLTAIPEPAKLELNDGTEIPCLYRPNTLKLTNTAKWKKQELSENNATRATFSGGSSATLELNLFFDTTDTGDDVRSYTDQIIKLTVKENADDSQPPLCKFVWGEFQSFEGYTESVTVTYSYFMGDGTPLRADVSFTLNQFVDESQQAGQNPTSYSEARKTWVVTEGERLDWIAYKEYGSPGHWRHIAEVNNLSNPFELRSGQILKLTPLP